VLREASKSYYECSSLKTKTSCRCAKTMISIHYYCFHYTLFWVVLMLHSSILGINRQYKIIAFDKNKKTIPSIWSLLGCIIECITALWRGLWHWYWWFSIIFVCKLELCTYCTIISLEFNRISMAAFFKKWIWMCKLQHYYYTLLEKAKLAREISDRKNKIPHKFLGRKI